MVLLLTFFTHRVVSMVVVPWGVGAIPANGYRIQGQNYVALIQESEITADFLYRNYVLDI